MRYHTRSSLRSLSPNRPIDPLAIQRSQPTCILSLTSATGSMSSTESSTDSESMDVDPPTVSVEVPTARTTGAIPFPTSKRTHSLLRSTTLHSRHSPESLKSSTTLEPGDSHSSSDSDLNPPRKRTRTSALPSSTRPRSLRCNSTPSRVSASLAHSPSSVTFHASISTPTCPFVTNEPLPTQLSPPLSTSYNLPALAPQPDRVVNLSSLSLSSLPTCTPPIPPSSCRRKRATAGELHILLYLYRTLVYGLEVRYPDRPGRMRASQAAAVATESGVSDMPTGSSRVAAKSYLDVQDALLAQHLKTYLLANGTDICSLVVDVDAISQEGLRARTAASLEVDSIKMAIDDDLTDQCRKPSRLSECIIFD
ncbi:hypothetical protein BDZ97DRAFT_1844756 [Flammula alnicola]|nr:hypothetical protein BDZ97DRAFT_1844756 [Flammula alnicola]